MTRSENMKRLWADPAFRERTRKRQSATMQATNLRLWQQPEYREWQQDRLRALRLQLSIRAACRRALRDKWLGEGKEWVP